jgi:tetratricopeptide (TPR) repeat protein
MRRALILTAALLWLAGTGQAQIGKQVMVRAGTEEDARLQQIQNTADPQEKIRLLEEFLADFGDTDAALIAYEMLVSQYMAVQNAAKVYEYGEKALQADPDNFTMALNLFRTAQEQNDLERMFTYGKTLSDIVARYKARPAPAGTPEDVWQQQKQQTLEGVASSVNYVELTLFNAAYRTQDLAQKAALLERFLAAFPDSQYAASAQALVAATYQQTQQYDKMLEFAQGILGRDPNNIQMLLLLADYWTERGEELAKAEEYAQRALQALEAATRPEPLSEEQWQQQTSLQKGLAHSALGMVRAHRKQFAQAVEEFRAASPLLKADNFSYARNLYRLGFTLANLRRIREARQALTEAVSIDSPYKALAQKELDRLGGPVPRE